MSGLSASGNAAITVLRAGAPRQRVSDHDLYEMCRANPELRIERTSDGDLEIMPPTTADTGRRNFRLIAELGRWAEEDGTGVGFDSSTGFTLPNGAMRSPDVAWVRRERWEQLEEAARDEFAPICPDFVAELRSRSDSPRRLQAKMDEYVANGARLGWLIDPVDRKVYVYRPGAGAQCFDDPAAVSGDPVLPGLVLNLAAIW